MTEGAGAAHLDRNVQRLERARIRDDALVLLPREDEEVAELAALRVDLRPDVSGDPIGILFQSLPESAAVRQGEDAAGRGFVIVRLERGERK